MAFEASVEVNNEVFQESHPEFADTQANEELITDEGRDIDK